LSKVLEKVVAACLEHHLDRNSLHDDVQSAYRSCHSTATALLRVHHDITVALDNNCCAVLLMLDLSAAFDTIDHDILIQRLEYSFWIIESALMWFNSYLTGRTQRVAVGSTISNTLHLKFGVPQGSVLGPRLYCMFAKPIGEICKRHNMLYHCYADDTQVYLVIEPCDNWNNVSIRLQVCLSDISSWMRTNLLKLNQDKTELIIFAPKHRMQTFTQCELVFDGIVVSDASFVKNLGVYFDKTLTMDKQSSAIAKSCYYQIRNIGRIRSYISDDACKTLVCSLVTSRLDYGNALLYGVNRTVIDRLQRVQNTAARMITRRRKHDHITPTLVALHWLPVQYRCQYKILLYVIKSLHGTAPAYLSELIAIHRPSRTLRSENSARINPPRIRTKTYGERRFDKSAATLWNNLPHEIRVLDSIDAFKSKLKTFLFRQAFSDFV